MTHSVPDPVSRLLTLGRKGARGDWLDYRTFGLTAEHIPALLSVVREFGLELSESDEEYFAPVHAWRALAQSGLPVGAGAAAP